MTDFWEGKNIFITGAGGFVGSWITKTLVEMKAKVISRIVDRPHTSGGHIRSARYGKFRRS